MNIQDNNPNITLEEIQGIIKVDDYRMLYTSVGKKYNWLDRIFMEDSVLYEKINSPKTHIYTFQINGNFAGYTELVEEESSIEILYFGLTDPYIGKGYGTYLLTKTIKKAWSFSPTQLILNTCDLDHSNALNTYLKAGFKAYKTIYETKRVVSREL